MELKTTKAQLAKYFSAWLNWWVNANKLTQLQAAIRLEVTPGFVNMIINNKRAASAGQMEKIAKSINSDLLDILLRGRQLSGEHKPTLPHITKRNEDEISAELSKEQIDDLETYRNLLIIGGEGVEVITEAIRYLAKNKNIPINLRTRIKSN